MLRIAVFVTFALCVAPRAGAEVEAVTIDRREPVLDGRPFGDAGAYEKLVGTIHFAFDPGNPYNDAIVDLERAPRGEDGRVRAEADLMVLQPTDPEQRAGTALVEVSNRGGKAALGYFCRAAYASDPAMEEHFGDGLLLRRGLTLVWVGWQFDVPLEEGRLRLRAPVATGSDGQPLEGLVRCDWTVDEPAAQLALGHRDHVPYAIADRAAAENVLTWRSGRYAERQVVPRTGWRFTEDGLAIAMAGGSFAPGRIYELVYRARDPVVVGLGLAAIRDVASYTKSGAEDCPFPVERALAFGVSQTGRFLRHFLWQGFNTDELGQPAYDGLLVHSAGAGRGSFNHRFAQPSRDAHRYSAFFYPTDVFPFAGRVLRDPETGARDGLLELLRVRSDVPKVMYTNTGYEYWGRAASLLHTSLDGSADVDPLPTERIYHLASGQHFAGPWPPRDELALDGPTPAWRGNPLDFLVTLRALLVALDEWVTDGVEPPPSAFPRVADGTLVPVGELRFPELAGVPAPAVAHAAHRLDFGEDWDDGVATREPPGLGPPFAVLVPQVDGFGNEVAGLRTVETVAPLGTCAPWCVRAGFEGGEGELWDFWGTWVPLARTREEARERGDPRPPAEVLYASREAYLEEVEITARRLAAERTLLEEDIERVLARAAATWDWLQAQD